jgi:hypothetical protein
MRLCKGFIRYSTDYRILWTNITDLISIQMLSNSIITFEYRTISLNDVLVYVTLESIIRNLKGSEMVWPLFNWPSTFSYKRTQNYWHLCTSYEQNYKIVKWIWFMISICWCDRVVNWRNFFNCKRHLRTNTLDSYRSTIRTNSNRVRVDRSCSGKL